MACAGALTSIVMTAAGAYISNGGLDGLLGDAPIAGGVVESGVAGIPVTEIDVITGEVVNSTTTTVVQQTVTQQNLTWFQQFKADLAELANFPDTFKQEWNNMAVGLGDDVWYGAYDIFGDKTAQVLGNLTTSAVDAAGQYGLAWAAGNLGGTYLEGVLTGNPKIFGTILSTAESYITTANQFLVAAENAEQYLKDTFTSLDNTITGAIDGVSRAFEDLGEDLAKLGETWDWEDLENLGSPGQLLANLDVAGTLGVLYDKIADIEVDEETARQLGANLSVAVLDRLVNDGNGRITVQDLGLDVNALARQGAELPPAFQGQLYQTFTTLSTDEVASVKAILNNTQDAVQTGADLFDPKKLLPESYETTTTPIRVASPGSRAIYENDTGSVNPQLNNLGNNLKGILPDDVAIANGALSRSLRQIKNITNTNTSTFSSAVQQLETLKDLPLLQNQTEYVSENVRQFWIDYYGIDQNNNIPLATGNAGQYKLSDIIGFAAGYNSAAPLQQNTRLLTELQAEGKLNPIYADAGPSSSSTGISKVIAYFFNGTYTTPPDEESPGDSWEIVIPAGVYGAGTYEGDTELEAQQNAWSNGIIPAAKQLMRDLYNSDERFQILTRNEDRIQEQLARERLNQQRIDLNLNTIPASDTVALNLAQNLPNYGLDTSEGGAAELLERVVNYNSLGGQATIAAMREGRNLNRLADANIGQDAPLSTQGLKDPGTLLTGQYTKQEALDLIIKS